ncbi:MAG: histidine kinase [Candidatus Thiodiazotropha sp. (ex Lucinoma borealis)]|nr:histidine kinase [Candidatus Thiodiazotropha sp. (ex Lucinoma borealis)]
MQLKKHPRFTQSLRFKLLLASLTLFLIPWAGYHYLSEMEASLRQAQETLLLNRAEIVANMLATDSSNWLTDSQAGENISTNSLYVHPLKKQPILDGYAEEWLALKSQSRQFKASASRSDAVSFEWLAGFYADSLYLLIDIHDQQIIYPHTERKLGSGDHLILALPGPSGISRQYHLGTPAPGWINVIEHGTNRPQTAIHGEWQESSQGYRVELKLPRSLANGRLSLAAVDIDQLDAKPDGIASTSGWNKNHNLAHLVMPTMQADRLLQGLDSTNHRYSILNRARQVLGRHGSIQPIINNTHTLISRILSLLTSTPEGSADDLREGAGQLDGPEIRRALSGDGAVNRYKLSGTKALVLAAAYPIKIDQHITGIVVVEQSTQKILLLQQSALERLFYISLILFIVTGGTLLLFASSLTRRITLLNRKYNQAVSKDGRIIEEVATVIDGDELAELDRSFSVVLKRSKDYTGYLESMASRLAHEFRTPLTIVQTSLENIQTDNNPTQGAPYIQHALEGTHRLNLILTRLREASRLEQSLQNTERVKVDILALCKALYDGYVITYPDIEIECRIPTHQIWIDVSPDLISQALDKLISNAVDFHRPRTAIKIELDTENSNKILIKVKNQGPQIPEIDQSKIFDSMVSRRKNSDQQQTHLGLGLYLVRLIAEFHQGKAWAINEVDGVCFVIDLPNKC